MYNVEQEARSYVGTVVTFNGLADYTEYHSTGFVIEPLEGHIGFITDAKVHWSDDGDGENGPRLSCWVNLIVYVPAYGKCFATSPDEWSNPCNN